MLLLIQGSLFGKVWEKLFLFIKLYPLKQINEKLWLKH